MTHPDQLVDQAVRRGLIAHAGTEVAAAIRVLSNRSPAEAEQLAAAARPIDAAAIAIRATGGTLEGAVGQMMRLGLTRERAEAALVRQYCGIGADAVLSSSSLTADQRAAVESHLRAKGASLDGIIANLTSGGAMTRQRAEDLVHRQVVAELEHAVRR